MSDDISIEPAGVRDAAAAAVLVGELLDEIMAATGAPAFNFNLAETATRLADFIERGRYFVLLARAGEVECGLAAVYEAQALYAEGRFGTLPELYVRPQYRSQGIGTRLLDGIKSYGAAQGWTRIEATTPPLPQFERTLAFYEREGFAVSGGRKLRISI